MKLYLDELQNKESAEGFLPRSYQLEKKLRTRPHKSPPKHLCDDEQNLATVAVMF